MLQALIFICSLGTVPECDGAHAVWQDRAPGTFMTTEECQGGALTYLHTINFDNILEEGHDYKITISCREAPV